MLLTGGIAPNTGLLMLLTGGIAPTTGLLMLLTSGIALEAREEAGGGSVK